MRTTPAAAAPFSGRLACLPRGPAQAAARDLPGCREREVGRGKRSPVRHGAVWKNPGEASQRAGKGERPGGARWAAELGAGRPRSQAGPYFRGLPLGLGAEGRV